ncbi:hypothetical protein G9C98_003136 [Cotesia typhae]|uniref:Collagen type XV/XVIII trimerization domain-containing protein n=1 Tax=Cotesia typhae TaxID=2053667 RepID=A0A8J5RFS7_9HYME|nr:hypothetical protein G9C98_003136 [Cotesia typhae]
MAYLGYQVKMVNEAYQVHQDLLVLLVYHLLVKRVNQGLVEATILEKKIIMDLVQVYFFLLNVIQFILIIANYSTAYMQPGSRSNIEELKVIQELKQLKDLKDYLGRIGAIRNIYESTTKIVPGAVTFQNTDAMIKMSTISPVGTLAYIIDEEALLVRVNNGWQYIAYVYQLGTLLSTSTQATVTPALYNPPFEASNLINQLPIRTDGSGVSIIFYSLKLSFLECID